MQTIFRRIRSVDIVFLGFISASVAALWRPLSALVAFSLTHEYCSHIILIPAISAWFIYLNSRLIGNVSRVWVFGVLLVLPAIPVLVWTMARKATLDQNDFLAGIAFCIICLWIAGFAVCYGPKASRVAMFPLLFLFFMVPLPTPVLHETTYLLQKGSTEITWWLLQAVGLPSLKEGFIIRTPTLSILVAEECSGIRSSLALLITCLLAAQMMLKSNWRRAVFVLLSFPVALIKNGIRIATLVLLSVYVDMRFMTGRLHHEGGVVFFIIALLIMVPFLKLLQKSESSSDSRAANPTELAKQSADA